MQTNGPALRRRAVLAGAAGALFTPYIAKGAGKAIRIGVPTILSGRVALLGSSSRNGMMMEIERVNAQGGLAGRPIEIVLRDSRGQAQESARNTRDLINTEGCEIIIDAEPSSGAFAVNEVVRDLGTLCIHTNSETSSLTADPKIRLPNAFRCARQGVHDSVVGGSYAAKVANQQKLHRWATASPDYAYGRDTTAQYLQYLKHFKPDIEVITQSWPKLFQPDYTDNITKIMQAKPQALYSALWAGDLVAFIDQSSIYALFNGTKLFAVNMADYPVLTAIKHLPKGIHSGDRYLTTFPDTPANKAFGEAYNKRFGEYPTNWSWQNATAVRFLAAAAKAVGSSDGKQMAAALAGMKIESPFGTSGQITMRAADHTIVEYAIGWGTTVPKFPYVEAMQPGDWGQIFELEQEWKKQQGYT
jgi:branched-chain amino acid transport system substrate-binding protein